jgi:hypothetical protein
MISAPKKASATTRVSSELNAGSARKRILPQREHGNRKNFQVLEGKKQNEVPPPSPPSPAVWVPRCDRRAIVEAFAFGLRIHKLAYSQRRPLFVIESVIREELDELRGQLRALQSDRISLVRQRLAA